MARSRGGIQVLPPPFPNQFAGVAGFANNLVAGLLQQQQQKSLAGQLSILGQQLQGGGQIDFSAFTNPQVHQLAIQAVSRQRQQQQPFTLTPGAERFTAGGQPVAQVPAAARPPISPSQQRAQAQLDTYRAAKIIPVNQRTKSQQKTVDNFEETGQPLVQIGGLPGLFGALTPEERPIQARAELAKRIAPKALTPTEQKGVQVTVRSVLVESGLTGGLDSKGELIGKAVPFGVRRGAAVSQERIGQLWEQVMESTGYTSRDRGQQRQIDAVFDRQIKVLNKGKGITILKNQYQWNRALYNKTHRRTGETIDSFIKRTGL